MSTESTYTETKAVEMDTTGMDAAEVHYFNRYRSLCEIRDLKLILNSYNHHGTPSFPSGV